MRVTKRRGFTLVELLIVIVVIGILSAMMMLSSTEAVSSAKVAKILNNLRNWKTAMLEWYADNIDRVDANGKIINEDGNKTEFGVTISPIEIAKYINGEFTEVPTSQAYYAGKNPVKDGSGIIYWIRHDHLAGDKYAWYVCCKIDDDKRLIEKLINNAGKINISDRDFKTYPTDSGNLHMISVKVMDFSK
ncbi:MAG: type II secretion system protein [Synergistaceae bacterium]|nr:type II secretion system protein [Synergistaceae bacterium]